MKAGLIVQEDGWTVLTDKGKAIVAEADHVTSDATE